MARTATTPTPSPLAGLLDGTTRTRRGPQCEVTLRAPSMSQADQDLLAEAMSRTDVSTRDIRRALEDMGTPINATAIERHRAKACACWARAEAWRRGGRG